MSKQALEKRIETLEQEIHQIKSLISKQKISEKPWWEKNAGIFKEDPVFDEIIVEGEKYRKAKTD